MGGRLLLSAAMIVRDEEAFLDGCLRSLVDVVDEVVVVDTGSVDRTAAIAEAHGARLLQHGWHGDFAAARNQAIDAAQGDWILYIDADERLGDHDGLRHALATADGAVAAKVRFQAAAAWTPYREHRLFRNRPDLRFRGTIHETVLPDIDRIVAEEGARVVAVPASIRHLGYEGDLTPKYRRNLPLLEDAVRRDPARSYLWFDLGIARRGLGDDAGAEQAWSTGATAAIARESMEPVDLLLLQALALLRLADGRDATDLVAAMVAAHPDDPLTRWAQAQQAMADGRWADAATVLRALVAIDPDAIEHHVLAYNRSMFGAWAHQALGSCAFHLGDDEEAARWFDLAATSEPGNREYAVKRDLAAARARRRRAAQVGP